MPDIRVIDDREAVRIFQIEEGHYQDLKRIAIQPSKLSESVSAFANMSGGELFIGINEIKDDVGKVVAREWDGFKDQESANAHLKVIEELTPLGSHCKSEFLKNNSQTGYVLHFVIFKVRDIVFATDKSAYVRKGAQNVRLKDEESLRRLRLDKGIVSFEDETLQIGADRVSNSNAVVQFMLDVIPGANPEDWVVKQNLVVADKPTVAGVLLFDDEPQAVIPKRSAIKIYRYKSKQAEGDRETLAFTPITVEGCAYVQIYAAVDRVKN